jgi:uncharacterized protein YyaL (SSP411 family)
VGNGFIAYLVDAHWSIVHVEKLLSQDKKMKFKTDPIFNFSVAKWVKRIITCKGRGCEAGPLNME